VKRILKKVPYLRTTTLYLRSLLPRNWRVSRGIKEWHELLDRAQWWSEEEHRAYQWRALCRLLGYAYNHIRYYRELFESLGAAPGDFRDFADFARLPLLTKEIVRERIDDFVPDGVVDRRWLSEKTGGSTGEPLRFWKERSENFVQQAFAHEQWRRVDFRPGASVVILRGDPVTPIGKLWDYRPDSNEWLFSSYHFTPEHIRRFVEKMNAIRPEYLRIFPSALWAFVKLAQEAKAEFTFVPRAILSGSENLYPFQRGLFEAAFNCRVFNLYGQAEHVVMAAECEESRRLHVVPQYGYMELIGANGEVVAGSGASGEIVGTGFINRLMPFIRYRTGDLATYAPPSCGCGRHVPLLEGIEGRIQDFAMTRENKPCSVFLLYQVCERYGLWKFQIVQNEIGKLLIRCAVPRNPAFSKTAMIQSFVGQFANEFDFDVELTTDFPRTAGGKFRFFVCNIGPGRDSAMVDVTGDGFSRPRS
jgi:phenylacetate-CoA ligase